MRRSAILCPITIVVCFIAAASVLSGQVTSIKLFAPVNVRSSSSGTGRGASQVIFNSNTLNLSCDAAPIQAVLSSAPSAAGNVLVDNFINLTVTAGTSTSGPKNICIGPITEADSNVDCFTSGYQTPASQGQLTGKNPDTFVSTGGVAPIDISSSLHAGAVQAKIDLVDTGGYLTSSSIYLQTNCTNTGVAGPAEVTGNPISKSNPTPEQLKQDFSFNPTINQLVKFTYDLTEAQSAQQLTITDGTIPGTADLPIDPTTFQANYVAGTSFATSNCLIHSGELYNGQPACKLYTLECQVGTGATESGAQCPVSGLPNEIFQETFDGPGFTLPDIMVPGGPTFHQGIGFLMASEGWTGGPCTFDMASGLGSAICPQNVLTSFSGPGVYASTGRTTNPNSSFISVAPVPEDLTTVTVAGQRPGGWSSSHTLTVNLSTQPPMVPGATAAFVPSPIHAVTYGISTAATVPMPGSTNPSDIVLTNPIYCPAPNNPTVPPASVFAPAPQTITVPADGQYLLHYFAQDCAGTEELKFSQDALSSWATSFYTVRVNVDTVIPVVASGPTLSPLPTTNSGVANSYLLNQSVSASYSCTDDFSGLVRCGTHTYAPATTLNTGNLTSPIDTSTPGSKTFTVNAIDSAGNRSSASVSYQVVVPTVNLAVVKSAPSAVSRYSSFTYNIGAVNLGGGTASGVVVSDPLPAGVAFGSAAAQFITCSLSGCSTRVLPCDFDSHTVKCTAASLPPISASRIAGITVQIVVRAIAPSGTILRNTATVTSVNHDSDPHNNTSTASTKVK